MATQLEGTLKNSVPQHFKWAFEGYATPDQVYRSGQGGGACIVDKYAKRGQKTGEGSLGHANPQRLKRPVLA